MPTHQTSLSITTGLEFGFAALGFMSCVSFLWCHWRKGTDHFHGHYKAFRSMSAAALANALYFFFALYAFVQTRVTDSLLTDTLWDDIAYTRFAFGAAALGALIFSMAKFFRLNDTCTWSVTVSGTLGFAFLSVATYLSLGSVSNRWTFFAYACVGIAIAVIFMMLERYLGSYVSEEWTEKVAPSKLDETRGTAGFVKLWFAVIIMIIVLMWLLGVFGIGANQDSTTGNVIWEQSWYCACFILLFVVTPQVYSWSFCDPVFHDPNVTKARQWADKQEAQMVRDSPIARGGHSKRESARLVVIAGGQ